MLVNTRTGQGPAPCKFPCEAEVADKTDDQVEAEIRHARVAIIAQLLHQHSQQHEVDPEVVRQLLIEREPSLRTSVAPQVLRNAISWLTGYIGQGVAQEAVRTLCDDPRDFNDLVEAYEHRVDPAQFARRPNA